MFNTKHLNFLSSQVKITTLELIVIYLIESYINQTFSGDPFKLKSKTFNLSASRPLQLNWFKSYCCLKSRLENRIRQTCNSQVIFHEQLCSLIHITWIFHQISGLLHKIYDEIEVLVILLKLAPPYFLPETIFIFCDPSLVT